MKELRGDVETWGAGVPVERRKDIYMLLQLVVRQPGKGRDRRIHKREEEVIETGVYFTIDVTVENYEQVLKYNTVCKSYDGVRINVGEGVLNNGNYRAVPEGFKKKY